MEGADLVCEGIITPGAVSEMLLETDTDIRDESPAVKMMELFMKQRQDTVPCRHTDQRISPGPVNAGGT